MNSIRTNKHIITAVVLFFTAAATLMACRKEHDEPSHHNGPSIVFLSPMQSQVIDEKDTAWIRVNISSENDLHEYLVEVKNTITGNVVYAYEGHSHDKSVTTNLYFLPDVSQDADMVLTVTTLDHNSNKSSTGITFRISNTVASVNPVITIVSPDRAMYDHGERVGLEGVVRHIRELKEVKVELLQNNNVVFSYTPEVKGLDSMTFDTSYLIDSPHYSDFELVITASDVNENRSVKTQAFHVH